MTLITQAVTIAAAIARMVFVVSFFVSVGAFLAVPSVSDAQVVPTCSISAQPQQTVSGGTVALTWNSSNGTTASLTDFGSVGLNGSVSVANVTSQKTYVLTVSNGSASTSCSTTVTIGTTSGGTGVTPTCTIDASTSRVAPGQAVTLAWNTNNGISAALSSVGSVPLSGIQTVYPQSTTTYILTVNGNGTSNSCSRTVTVDTSYTGIPKCTLSADPVLVNNSTGSTTLTWTTQDATSVHISGVGDVQPNGSYTVYGITGERTFVLTAQGNNGVKSCSHTVWGNGTNANTSGGSNYIPVTGPQTTSGTPTNPGCYISVNPTYVTNGSTVLSWNAAGAYSATISGIGNVATSGTYAIAPTRTTVYTLTSIGANGVTRTCSTTARVEGSVANYYGAQNTYPYAYNQYNQYPQYNQYGYDDVYNPYSTYQRAQYSSGSYRYRVPLSSVPYTGFADVFMPLFSLATMVTSGYGLTRFRLV